VRLSRRGLDGQAYSGGLGAHVLGDFVLKWDGAGNDTRSFEQLAWEKAIKAVVRRHRRRSVLVGTRRYENPSVQSH